MNQFYVPSSSSSSPLTKTSNSSYMLIKPLLYFTQQANTTKILQDSKTRVKLPHYSLLKLESEAPSLLTRRQIGRKVLKYTSKVEIQSSCKKLPSQLRYLVPNCKHYILQSNSHLVKKGTNALAKSIHRTSSKHLLSLQISTAHSSGEKVNIRPLFNVIISKRQLESLKLTINPYFSSKNLPALKRTFASLHKLHNLTLITSNMTRESQQASNPLRTIVTNVHHLKSFYMKCFVTRTSCEEANYLIEKLTQNNSLEKIELFLATSDRLPMTFYSVLSDKISMNPVLNTLGVTIDSFTKQSFNNAFFFTLSRMKKLQKLIISADQLSIGDSEMQALFNALVHLNRLKEFKLHSNVRALNFSNDYYVSFHEALRHLTQLEDFTYELRNLGSGYFPRLFSELPMFPRLKALSLNVTISEGDLGNVHFLSEFLKHTKNLKSLTLKINDFANDNYTYGVPSEVFQILGEGLKATPTLERFELRLGSIEDGGLNRILLTLDELRELKCLKLDAFFHDITYQAFGNLCRKLREKKRRLHEVQIAPKSYSYSNYELLNKVINEIHMAR